MKKKRRILIGIILLVVIVVGIIIISSIKSKQDEQKHRLQIFYDNISGKDTYLFTARQNDQNKTIIGKKGDKTVIDNYSTDSHTTTIVENEKTTYILHDRKEYYIYNQNNIEQNILTEWFQEVLNKEYTTGEEKVNGKKYSYEEYPGSTMFMKSNMLDIDEATIKTRFYFDKKDKLVYIKTLYGDNNEELLKIEISNEVDDSIFGIPLDYADN